MASHVVQSYQNQAASFQNITKDDTSSDNIDVPGNKSCSRRLLPILILVVTGRDTQLSFSRGTGEVKPNQTPQITGKKKPYTEALRVSFKSCCTHPGLIKIAHPTDCTISELSRCNPAAACTTQNSKEAGFSWAYPSVSSSPLNRCIISGPSTAQAEDLPPLCACISVCCWPQKGDTTALVLCVILRPFI